MTSGAAVKTQVMDALVFGVGGRGLNNRALAALSDCVLLTREDVDAAVAIQHRLSVAFRRFDDSEDWDEVAYNDLWEAVKDFSRWRCALLTPEPKEQP